MEKLSVNNMFGSDFFQENYNISSSSYTDPFGDKFDGFDPANIVNGNNSLKSGVTDIDLEESNAIGYKNNGPATSPKPGKFMD